MVSVQHIFSARAHPGNDDGLPSLQRPKSIASMSTEEWRATYERDGCVDLWVEEEFNSGSRLVVGDSDVFDGVQ